MVYKIINLWVFESELGKMNLGLKDVDGVILLVLQFILYVDVKYGNWLGFFNVVKLFLVEFFYQCFNEKLVVIGILVVIGQFGVDMQVVLVNDGLVMIWYEK